MAPGALTANNAVVVSEDDPTTKTGRTAEGSALEAAIARFTARNPRSQELHEEALGSMPGGNTRAQMYTNPFPVCIKSGEGYRVTTEDGHV